MRRRSTNGALAIVTAIALAGCSTGSGSSRGSTAGASAARTSTTTTSTSSTTPSGQRAGATMLPVVSCPTTYGVGSLNPFVPRRLPAATTATGLAFYSNGLQTVLAPTGWACSALVAADGSERLDAYPPGNADLSVREVSPGMSVVELDSDYTGHGPGALLVCPLFPQSPAATFLQGGPPCPSPPTGQSTTHPTDDVVFQ